MPILETTNTSLGYKLAYTVLLTKQTYLDGAYTLALSHKKVNIKYPIIFLISEEITIDDQQKISNINGKVFFKLVKTISPLNKGIELNYAFPHFNEVWTKLRCFELEEWDYLCCLDCDMLLLNNIDNYFESSVKLISHRSTFEYIENIGLLNDYNVHLMACHTCVCNPMKRKDYPKWWNPVNCAYNQSIQPDEIIKINPNLINNNINIYKLNELKGFPPLSKNYFNSGLFIISPNKKIFQHLIKLVTGLTTDNKVFQFPEQDLLNLFFHKNWAALPLSLNFLKTIKISHPNLLKLNLINNIHYIMDKPWNFDFNNVQDPFYELNLIWKSTFDLTKAIKD